VRRELLSSFDAHDTSATTLAGAAAAFVIANSKAEATRQFPFNERIVLVWLRR
jgi:hypothetical protein